MAKFSFTQEPKAAPLQSKVAAPAKPAPQTNSASSKAPTAESNVAKMRKTLGAPPPGEVKTPTRKAPTAPAPPKRSLAPAGLRGAAQLSGAGGVSGAARLSGSPRASIGTASLAPAAPSPSSPSQSSGFSFSSAQDDSYSPPLDMSDPEFTREEFDGFNAPELPEFQTRQQSQMQPLGSSHPGDAKAAHHVLGIAQHAFHQEDERVPAGSHYPPWVWNACEDPRATVPQTTVELYVMPAQSESAKAEPRFNARNHCLINLPLQGMTTPWEGAERVLLIPVSYKRVSPSVGGSGSNSGAQAGTHSQRVRDALGASQCLAQGYDQMSVLGRCMIQAADVEDDYWVIVSKKCALQIESRLRFTSGLQTYGLQSVTTAPSNRVGSNGVAPLQRYLGAWKGEQADLAIKLAHEQAGPMRPLGCSDEEMEVLRAEHLTLGAAANASQESNPFANPFANPLTGQLSDDEPEQVRTPAPARMRG